MEKIEKENILLDEKSESIFNLKKTKEELIAFRASTLENLVTQREKLAGLHEQHKQSQNVSTNMIKVNTIITDENSKYL